jgi:hypothetical protein
MIRGPRLRRFRIRPFGRRRNERLDELMAEADDLIRAHVAADHAIRQTRLKWLIDDAATGREIGFATRHEVPLRMQHLHALRDLRSADQLDLPDTLATIAAVLLEHARSRRPQARRKLLSEGRCGSIEMRIGAPSEMLRAVQDLFHPHLEDGVGMGADPRPAGRDFAKQGIELMPRLARVQRVDPDKDPVRGQELITNFIREGLVINGGFGIDADGA